MNKETIKAMNKKPTPHYISAAKAWWRKNDYKVLRVILFPIWLGMLFWEKIQKKLNAYNAWDETRAQEILDYYIPRKARWDAENQEFYFFDNGIGWGWYFAKKYIKKRDRRFWKLHAVGGGWKMREYLIKKFELEGFTKEVLNTYDGWTEISFKMREE